MYMLYWCIYKYLYSDRDCKRRKKEGGVEVNNNKNKRYTQKSSTILSAQAYLQ